MKGLGLHLPGPSGSVMMAFVIRSTGHKAAAGDITVQVFTIPLSNPNCVQTAALRFSDSAARALRALVNPG